jgi:DNA-binding CsgD family transcriptional regulator
MEKPKQTFDQSRKIRVTEKEAEIIRLICDGMPTNEIASKLEMAQQGVKNHLLHIFNAVGCSSRVEMLVMLGMVKFDLSRLVVRNEKGGPGRHCADARNP